MNSKVFIAIMILCATALFFTKKSYVPGDEISMNSSQFVVNEQFAPWLDMGQSQSLAGLIWIQSVAYFGGSLLSNENANQMGQILKGIIALDPKFVSAYEWAGIFDQVPKKDAYEILEKGIVQFPQNWRLHLYYANKLVSADINYVKAAEVMRSQKDNLDAPEYIRLTYKRFETLTDDTNLRISLLAEKLFGNQSVLGEELANKIYNIAIEYQDKEQIGQALETIKKGEPTTYTLALRSLFKKNENP